MSDKNDDVGVGAGASLQKIVSSLPVDHAGTTVYLKGWRLEQTTQPPIVIVHDLGEHAELYRETAEAFAVAGYTTYVFDLRGHGRSGRRLGHSPSFAILVKDLLQVAAWVRHKEGGRAPVILGHGIGALITMEFTKLHGTFCHAAILSAPCLEPIHETPALIRLALRAIAEIAPTYRLPTALFPRFARDLLDKERQTPLTAALAHELLLAIKHADARFSEYHGEVLILCPERDQILGYSYLKKLAVLHNEHNLLIESLADANHCVFTESVPTRELAMRAILRWLATAMVDKRVPDLPEVPRSTVHETELDALPMTPRLPTRMDLTKPGASKE